MYSKVIFYLSNDGNRLTLSTVFYVQTLPTIADKSSRKKAFLGGDRKILASLEKLKKMLDSHNEMAINKLVCQVGRLRLCLGIS